MLGVTQFIKMLKHIDTDKKLIKLKSIDFEILSELMKNARISDRTVAKKLGVSQPTVTRRRARMEKEGLLEYTTLPDFSKLGIEIMAISFSKWTSEALAEVLPKERFDEQVKKFLSIHPNVIFAATCGFYLCA
jgi:DNA-binding Lrp family transcriptional regulator